MFNYFYHQRIRRSVAMFGRLFNDIYVLRTDANDQVLSQQKVPLAYAPKAKFLERIRENPDLYNDQRVAIKLPRMSFEMTSMVYDPQRQLSKTNQMLVRNTSSTDTRSSKMYSGVPYILGFQLSVYAKNQDDALQIVEQIFPYFNPQYTLTIKPFDDFQDIKEDVPVVLVGASFSDDYEGSVEQRRTIIYTLDFEMKVMFYGPISDSSIIREANVEFYTKDAEMNDSDKLQTLTVEPNPLNVSPDSDYGFTTTISLTVDSA